ncbi:MAG: hypothetical protein ACO3GN_05795 [Bacteroidia bacterium]
MGFLDNILDHFNNSELTIAPNKKLRTLSNEFKEAFEVSLVFYKGKQIADGELTLAGLNSKTTQSVNTTSKAAIKIKASMKIVDVEQLFETTYGTKVQIKCPEGKRLIPNDITIGQGARGEY